MTGMKFRRILQQMIGCRYYRVRGTFRVSSVIKFITVVFIIFISVNFFVPQKSLSSNEILGNNMKSPVKFVIAWNRKPECVPAEPITKRLDDCDIDNCIVTMNSSFIEKSDALLFYHNIFPRFPPNRTKSNQKWVFVTYESPYSVNLGMNGGGGYRDEEWKKQFDWTMSYRHDSEAWSPYGVITHRNLIKNKDYLNIYRSKKKDIAWVVSNCNTKSKREEYVRQMEKILKIDVFGLCGGRQYEGSSIQLKRNLTKDYKLYLSFENSVCTDYMTEKLFEIYAEGVDMIPVVRGAPNSKKYLPNGTHIYTSDFNSPTELAQYLKKVISDEVLYTSYLKEKDKYVNKYDALPVDVGLCNLCKRLNENYASHNNLDLSAWVWKDQCFDPKDISVVYK